jgi:hypothetical protein
VDAMTQSYLDVYEEICSTRRLAARAAESGYFPIRPTSESNSFASA